MKTVELPNGRSIPVLTSTSSMVDMDYGQGIICDECRRNVTRVRILSYENFDDYDGGMQRAILCEFCDREKIREIVANYS